MREENNGSALSHAQIDAFFARLARENPRPQGELFYTNPFTLLVAVVLSAQSTDKGVNKITPALFAKADTPEKMLCLGEENIRKMIRTLGLFNSKARNVYRLSQQIVQEHKGQVPANREALEKLAGVGRKTANVVCNIAFSMPTIAVDTHIFRVANRTGLGAGKTPLEVERALERSVPQRYKLHAHHWLILHGRYVCRARAPRCSACEVADFCNWNEKEKFMTEKPL